MAGVTLHRIGESRRYAFAESECLAANCFDACVVRDIDSGKEHGLCRTRALSGCPPPETRHHSVLLASKRAGTLGWRIDP